MKKIISMLLAACMLTFCVTACGDAATTTTDEPAPSVADTQADEAPATDDVASSGDQKTVGFVTFGNQIEFFQFLADEYVKVLTDAGYNALYEDGAIDPGTQIAKCENFIAMGVDVLIVHSVAPEAMDSIVSACEEKGIKLIAFVAPTSSYDAAMTAEDLDMAMDFNTMAAKWIDENYADAEAGSVPVAVLYCDKADTGKVQGDEIMNIANYSDKVGEVYKIECSEETQSVGQANMETFYLQHPEVKVFLSAHNGLTLGVNSYFTGISSPVTDYTGMGLFCINGDESVQAAIASEESPFRGTAMTGSINDTANEILMVVNGVLDGSLEKGYVQKATTLYITPSGPTTDLETITF